MPADLRFVPEEGIVYATERGAVDSARREEEIRALAADPRLKPGMGILVDLLESESVPSLEEARRLADLHADPGLLRGHRVALLVKTSVHLGVANMVATMANLRGAHLRAFTDAGKARSWLREPPLFEEGT